MNPAMTVVLILMAIALTACSSPLSMPDGFPQDPLVMVRVLNETMNSQQFSVAQSIFADDITFINSDGKTYTGKTAAREWMQTRYHPPSEVSDIWLTGETIAWRVRIRENGVVRHAKSEAVMRDGKIQSLRWFEPDENPASEIW